MTMGMSMALGALIFGAALGPVSAQMPEGSVYVLHSQAMGGCPSLDWYIVVEAGDTLAGMIAWNDMKTMTKASGRVDRPHHTFSMIATEIGGQKRTATVEGKVEGDGRIVANIKGPNVTCAAVAIPINKVPPGMGPQ
jgi:hypothetical protein